MGDSMMHYRGELSMAYERIILRVFPDPEELAAAAAEQITAAARESIAARGRFTLCLTGGSSPRRAYTILAGAQGEAAIDWSRTYLFFGDERYVPHDDDRSNYKMVHDSLLQNPAIAADHVFAIPTHLPTPQQAAEEYAGVLQEFFGYDVAWPEFDLVLLGMGDDGHTASLFPGATALKIKEDFASSENAGRWATASPPGVLPPPVDRVTLTFPVFNAARQVMFMVSGANKAPALADIFSGSASVRERPAKGIRPTTGQLLWLVDRPAAGSLTT
jgi:6-phosphogluconolactonase